jgi:hypothetical protein
MSDAVVKLPMWARKSIGFGGFVLIGMLFLAASGYAALSDVRWFVAYPCLFAGALVVRWILLALERGLALAVRENVLRDSGYTGHLGSKLETANRRLHELESAMSQVGELFDHIGMALEASSYTQQSTDLKFLGDVLRQQRLDREYGKAPHIQGSLRELAHRYPVWPAVESLPVDNAHQITCRGEFILESVVTAVAGPTA